MALKGTGSSSFPETRAEYVKPTVLAIELKAEEVLAVGCKTQSVPFGMNVGYAACGIANGCAGEGS